MCKTQQKICLVYVLYTLEKMEKQHSGLQKRVSCEYILTLAILYYGWMNKWVVTVGLQMTLL